jgi:hypothetical protein
MSHLHSVELRRGIWCCSTCPAAWERHRMIPAGSLVTLGSFATR